MRFAKRWCCARGQGGPLSERLFAAVTGTRGALTAVAVLSLALSAAETPAGSIYTPYACTNFVGLPHVSGTNDGSGAAARFNVPGGVATDTTGNVYVADAANTIRKITPAGTVTTLAGSAGQAGFSDGYGGTARFNNPIGIAVDRFGNIYVAEEANDLIRRITPGGMVTTLVGSPNLEGRSDGIGSTALFYGPVGVAVDRVGNLYVADSNNARIAKCTQAFLEFSSPIGSLMLSSGSFHTWLSGPADKRVVVEASTDLLSWTPVLTNVLPAGGASLGVPVGNNQFRFLRSRFSP